MGTFLLDTSVIIDTINGRKGRRQLLRDLIKQGNELGCCPINVTEVYAGLRPGEETSTRTFLESLELYPMTGPVAELAGALKRDYGKRGRTLNLGDAIIAATAIQNKLTLLTDNVKDFSMRDVLLYPMPH